MQNWMQKSYFTRLTFKLHTLSKNDKKKITLLNLKERETSKNRSYFWFLFHVI